MVVITDFPPPPLEEISSPPFTSVRRKTDNEIQIQWRDNSLVELGFRLEKQNTSGAWGVVGFVEPVSNGVTPIFNFPNLNANTNYCFRVLANAIASLRDVKIECDLNLESGNRITKRLILESSAASNVMIDFNKAQLVGDSTSINTGKDMIEIKSQRMKGQKTF